MTDSPAIGSPSRGKSRVSPALLRRARFVLPCFLLFSCQSELPPLQEVEIEGDAESVSRLAGTWYGEEGEPLLTVRTRSPARLSFRIDPAFHPTRAWADAEELYFEVENGNEAPVTLWVRDLESDLVFFVPPGGSPPWCRSCDPGLRRFAAAWMADPRLRPIEDYPGKVYDEVVERLAEVF